LGRDDGKDKGEHSAIFYKKDEFTLLNKGDFWLSQTSDKPSLVGMLPVATASARGFTYSIRKAVRNFIFQCAL
jgi:hypothetical protein